jgi:hypothetical protein
MKTVAKAYLRQKLTQPMPIKEGRRPAHDRGRARLHGRNAARARRLRTVASSGQADP